MKTLSHSSNGERARDDGVFAELTHGETHGGVSLVDFQTRRR